jgi:hypothetical protein
VIDWIWWYAGDRRSMVKEVTDGQNGIFLLLLLALILPPCFSSSLSSIIIYHTYGPWSIIYWEKGERLTLAIH